MMTYIKIILTIIAVTLILMACKLLLKNPQDVNVEMIGGRYIEYSEPVRVKIVK